MSTPKVHRLYPLVKEILTDIPLTRSSDEYLYIHVINILCKRNGLGNIINERVPHFFIARRYYNLPSIETVGRIRRKVQEENKELRAARAVQGFREELEKEFKRFAGGHYNG